MRILMLNHNVAWSGGTFFRAYHFARHLVKRGHSVTLMTISPKQRFGFYQEVLDGLILVETPDWFWGRGRTGWDPWDILLRSFYVREQEWDLVHAFDSRPVVVVPALALKHRGVPLVMDWADWWGRGGTIKERTNGFWIRILIGPIETYFEEAFRTRAQGTTVISSVIQERAIGLGVKTDSMLLIPQGSDVENVRPLPREDCRKALGLPMRVPILGYLGVLNKTDAQLLFNAFACLLHTRPECRLLMIGNHRVALPRSDSIIEPGYVTHTQLLQYLGACDLMLLPLKNTVASRGRWPSKINDYLAAGRPIVSTAVGDVSKLFERHLIGRTTADTPEAFAWAVATLLSDASLLEEMGRNARLMAENELSWPILTERLEAFYFRILQ